MAVTYKNYTPGRLRAIERTLCWRLLGAGCAAGFLPEEWTSAPQLWPVGANSARSPTLKHRLRAAEALLLDSAQPASREPE